MSVPAGGGQPKMLTKPDLSVLTLAPGAFKAERLLQTPATELNGELSPDGRWLAYQSNESGQQVEVYVRPFPSVDTGRSQVSNSGGSRPLWAHNGPVPDDQESRAARESDCHPTQHGRRGALGRGTQTARAGQIDSSAGSLHSSGQESLSKPRQQIGMISRAVFTNVPPVPTRPSKSHSATFRVRRDSW
jgi:hypothetical protein